MIVNNNKCEYEYIFNAVGNTMQDHKAKKHKNKNQLILIGDWQHYRKNLFSYDQTIIRNIKAMGLMVDDHLGRF